MNDQRNVLSVEMLLLKFSVIESLLAEIKDHIDNTETYSIPLRRQHDLALRELSKLKGELLNEMMRGAA